MPIEGTFRAHQVPLSNVRENPAASEAARSLDARATSPKNYSISEGHLIAELAALAPDGNRRMGANPHANGGRLLKALDLPDFAQYALEIPAPGSVSPKRRASWANILRDVIKLNPDNFRTVLPRRNQLEPPERRFRRHRPLHHGADRFDRRSRQPARPRDGSAQRTLLRRLARRLFAHRPPRHVVVV